MLKLKKTVIQAAAATAVFIGGAGIGALADHFTVNSVPKGWTSTKTEGGKTCYNGCSSNTVPCSDPGKHGSQTTGGTITYHPKGEGGMNNPHVFSVSLPSGPKVGPNGETCGN